MVDDVFWRDDWAFGTKAGEAGEEGGEERGKGEEAKEVGEETADEEGNLVSYGCEFAE